MHDAAMSYVRARRMAPSCPPGSALFAAVTSALLLSSCAHASGSSRASHSTTTTHATSPLTVAALGDSVPSGLGTQSFVDMVGHALAAEQHRSLVLNNEAVSGVDSSDVAAQLTTVGGGASRAVRAADLTIIEVGANDFDETSASKASCAPVQKSNCYSSDMASLRKDLASILSEVKAVQKPGSRVVILGYWNNFADGKVGAQNGSDFIAQGRALTQWTNSTIQSVAKAAGVRYVDVYTPFFAAGDVTSKLQSDGEHPNVAGQKIIANAVLKALGSSARA